MWAINEPNIPDNKPNIENSIKEDVRTKPLVAPNVLNMADWCLLWSKPSCKAENARKTELKHVKNRIELRAFVTWLIISRTCSLND